jgi:hypothetical protein
MLRQISNHFCTITGDNYTTHIQIYQIFIGYLNLKMEKRRPGVAWAAPGPK